MKKSIFCFLLCMTLLLSGCSTKENDTTFTQSGGNAVVSSSKNTITLSMRIPETLNPLRNKEASVDQILKLIFKPLIAFDANNKATPSIAESWTVSETGNVISLNLFDNLYWENGNPVTAKDVAFSIETIRGAEDTSMYKNVMNYIKGYSVRGDYTIDIQFAENFSGNISALQFPVISEAYYKGQTDLASSVNMTPMGNGAYRMSSYKLASYLELQAVNTEASIAHINVKISTDTAVDALSFEQSLLDVLVTDAIDAGKYVQDGKTSLYEYTSRNYDYIAFNYALELFQNKNMRQTISYALPRQTIYESVYLKYAKMTYTPISPTSWLYEENIAPYAFDTTMANTLLKNMGWIDVDGDGKLEKVDGETRTNLSVRILVNKENATRVQIAKKLEEELNLLGFRVTLDIQPFDVFLEKYTTGDFEMVIAGMKMSAITDFTPLLGTGGNMNFSGYSDEQMDTLLQNAYTAIGDGQTLLAYSSLQKKIAEDLPYISIAYRNEGLFLRDSISGEISPTVDNVFSSIERWELNQ